MSPADSKLAQAVLDFWFGEPGSAEYGSARSMWFVKSDAFDAELDERFGSLVAQALDGGLDDWSKDRTSPGPSLAFIVLLDQMARNIYRGTSRMFAGDTRALLTARAMVAAGQDLSLSPVERQFCYLPFEHAEDSVMQAESLRLFAQLKPFPETANVYEWAVKHAVIIQRFGRYPHRNAVLARRSTPEETEFLKQPGSGF